MGSALAQLFGEITLGFYVQNQNFFAIHGKTVPQVVDGGAFTNAPFWFATLNTFAFAIDEVPHVRIDLAACGVTVGYVWAGKSAGCCTGAPIK